MFSLQPCLGRIPRIVFIALVDLPIILAANPAHATAPESESDVSAVTAAALALMPIKAFSQVKATRNVYAYLRVRGLKRAGSPT